jgi:excisionase family DNA binding protein
MTLPITDPIYRRERFEAAKARGDDPRGKCPVTVHPCRVCHERSARTAPRGGECLECLARRVLAGRKPPWSNAEADVLERYYGLMTIAMLQGYLYRTVGAFRTQDGIKGKAREMGLDFRTHQDAVTVTELAGLLGINRSQVYNHVEKGEWMSIGHGRLRLIPLDEVDRILESHPPFPHDPITRHDAAAILAYSIEVVSQLTKAGRLRKWQKGKQVYWSRQQVEALARELREQGRTAREVLPPALIAYYRQKCLETKARRLARQRKQAS